MEVRCINNCGAFYLKLGKVYEVLDNYEEDGIKFYLIKTSDNTLSNCLSTRFEVVEE